MVQLTQAKIAIYVRVSTRYQIDRDSLPNQKRDLINYAKYILNTEDYEIFEDAGFSAKDTHRPAFQSMMSRAKTGNFSHILVWKIDRISRDLLDFIRMYEEWKKYRITFVSKNEQFDTSSAMGEAMLKIILVFAELERKTTAERVRSNMLSRAEQGLWCGAGIPYGYVWSDEKKFAVPDPAETLIVQHLFKRYTELKSVYALSHEVNAQGLKTKRGGTWTSTTLRNMIRNPFFKGTFRYNYRNNKGVMNPESEWIIIPNNHPGIISEELWQLCNDIMNRNALKDTSSHRKNVNIHIFSKLLKCGYCGCTMGGGQDKARSDGFKPSKYRCSSHNFKKGCKNKTSSDVAVAPIVLNYIGNFITAANNPPKTIRELERILLRGKHLSAIAHIDKECLNNIMRIIRISKSMPYQLTEAAESTDSSETASIEIKKAALDVELQKQKRALERLNNLFLFDDDTISEKYYMSQKNQISSDISTIRTQIEELDKKIVTDPNKCEYSAFFKMASYYYLNNSLLKAKNIDFKKLYQLVGPQALKDMINQIVDHIVIDDGLLTEIVFKNGLLNKFTYKCTSSKSNKDTEKMIA